MRVVCRSLARSRTACTCFACASHPQEVNSSQRPGYVAIQADVPLESMIGTCHRACERLRLAAHTCACERDKRNARAGYATALRSMTGGEGTFSMDFSEYAPLEGVSVAQLASRW